MATRWRRCIGAWTCVGTTDAGLARKSGLWPGLGGGSDILLATSLLGANPVEKLTRSLGEWALRFLLIGLAITPAAVLLRQPRLIRYRRTIGMWAFAYVFMHLTNYVALDHFFDWRTIGGDILKRPYITIGMTAFVLLIPLAVTSTNAMLRRLGPKRWKALHRLVYLIAVLGVIHYFLLVKADRTGPLVYGAVLAVLLGFRVWIWLKPRRGRKAPVRRETATA
jgi:sulfoxide reductase heme-binding subunit YedZ